MPKKLSCLMPVIFLTAVMCLHAQAVLSVAQQPSGPVVKLNGQQIDARMFWGKPGYGSVDASDSWTGHAFEFTASLDARATLHFRFGAKPGLIELKDLSFYAIDSGNDVLPPGSMDSQTGFDSAWNIWPPDARNTVGQVTFNDSMTTVTLSTPPDGAWPDFHFWSDVKTLRTGVRYRCSFKVRSDSPREIMPVVYHTGGGWTPIGGPQGPFARELGMARSAGVPFISFNMPACWLPPEDDPEWSHIHIVFDSILEIYPNALLIPRVSMDAPAWWKDRHPGSLMLYDDGALGDKVSISNREYAHDAAAHLETLCTYLCEQYPNHFAGIMPCGQNTGEWFYQDAWQNRLSGYDAATENAWQQWPGGGGTVPSAVERRSAEQGLLLHPGTQASVIEFNRFLQAEMADFICSLAAAARRGTAGEKLVLFFYGYHYELASLVNGPAAGGHCDLKSVLACRDLDALCGPLSYGDRGGGGTGPVMAPIESVHSAGKLWFNEDDTRTWLNANREDHQRYGGLPDRESTINVLRRNAAQASVRGTGFWWMDHGAGTPGGWFDDTDLWCVFDDMRPMDEAMGRRQKPFKPEVALFTHENSMLHLAGGSAVVGRHLIYNARQAAGRCGAPFGMYLLEDAWGSASEARLQVFLSAWALDDAERQYLLEARRSGVSRVWCWAPGFITPTGRGFESMDEVTGFSFRRSGALHAQAVPTDLGRSLGLSDAWGPEEKITPLFSINDDDAEVLAVYENGDPAVALRRHELGCDVFVGTPALSAELLRVLAADAGVHLYIDEGASVWASEGWAAVHSLEDGAVSVDIGSEASVYDALSGALLGQGPEFSLDLFCGETRMLNWSPATGVKSDGSMSGVELAQACPNPFRGQTRLTVALAKPARVDLNIYDISGRCVHRLVHGQHVGAGCHEFIWQAQHHPAGVYLARLSANGAARAVKLIHLGG